MIWVNKLHVLDVHYELQIGLPKWAACSAKSFMKIVFYRVYAVLCQRRYIMRVVRSNTNSSALCAKDEIFVIRENRLGQILPETNSNS